MAYLSKEQVRTIINNAPQGTTPAGIVSSLRSKGHQLEGYEDTMKTVVGQEQEKEKGLGGKLIERGKNIFGELKPKKPEEVSTYEKTSNLLGGSPRRILGQVVGAIGDITGTAISKGAKKIYETTISPEKREGIKKTAIDILDTPIGQAGLNALKSGTEAYQRFKQENPNVAKDLEAVVNIASILPVGKGVGLAGKATSEVTAGARKSVAKKIIGSAEKNVSEALAPTTKEAKYLTEKITPGFIQKGIIGSRETILKKAEERVKDLGRQIEEYISSGKLKGEVPKKNILSTIDDFAKSGMTEKGIVLDTEKIDLAEKMRGIVAQFGDKIPAEEAKSALRVLGEMTSRKKGFTGGEELAAQLEKDIYGSIAGELAKANPDLDVLNKSFNFYKNLAKITSETITRTKPQSGVFRKAAATLFASQGQGVFDTAIKYIGSKLFLDFVSSPFYKTISSRIKNKLAKAIYSGDKETANNIIKAVNSGKKVVIPSAVNDTRKQ